MIYSYLNVPQSHLNCTYKTYDFSEGKKLLESHLVQFVEGKWKGMVFIGKPGVGKTHLICATYFALQEHGVLPGSEVILFDWQELLNYLRAGFAESIRADAAIAKICEVQYLLLDDIKPETQGTFWKDILTEVIEYSYNAKTKLLLSTNADSADELIERWSLSDYHVSRLTSMVDIIVLKGRDRRVEV